MSILDTAQSALGGLRQRFATQTPSGYAGLDNTRSANPVYQDLNGQQPKGTGWAKNPNVRATTGANAGPEPWKPQPWTEPVQPTDPVRGTPGQGAMGGQPTSTQGKLSRLKSGANNFLAFGDAADNALDAAHEFANGNYLKAAAKGLQTFEVLPPARAIGAANATSKLMTGGNGIDDMIGHAIKYGHDRIFGDAAKNSLVTPEFQKEIDSGKFDNRKTAASDPVAGTDPNTAWGRGQDMVPQPQTTAAVPTQDQVPGLDQSRQAITRASNTLRQRLSDPSFTKSVIEGDPNDITGFSRFKNLASITPERAALAQAKGEYRRNFAEAQHYDPLEVDLTKANIAAGSHSRQLQWDMMQKQGEQNTKSMDRYKDTDKDGKLVEGEGYQKAMAALNAELQARGMSVNHLTPQAMAQFHSLYSGLKQPYDAANNSFGGKLWNVVNGETPFYSDRPSDYALHSVDNKGLVARVRNNMGNTTTGYTLANPNGLFGARNKDVSDQISAMSRKFGGTTISN
jgi:hypothetical protein